MKRSFSANLKKITGSRAQERDDNFADQLGINQKQTMTMLSLEVILPNPHNPRRTRSARKFEELKQSIKALGVLQAITVRPAHDQPGRYYVTFGEGRFLAAKELGLTQIPATVKEQTEDEALIEAIAENVIRENMNPVDRAHSLVDLHAALSKSAQCALSWNDVLASGKTGLSRRQLFNYLGLLTLPEAIQEEIRAGRLNEQHGRALRKLTNYPDLLANAHAYIQTKKLNGPEAESYVGNLLAQTKPEKRQVYRLEYRSDVELLAALEAKVEELRTRFASENA